MLVKFTNTLINSVPGDYLAKVDFDKVLEVSCRDEIVEADSKFFSFVEGGVMYFIDVAFENIEEKMSIPFINPTERQANIDMFHTIALDLKYKSITQGFYSKDI
jgi:hypothetical protein